MNWVHLILWDIRLGESAFALPLHCSASAGLLARRRQAFGGVCGTRQWDSLRGCWVYDLVSSAVGSDK